MNDLNNDLVVFEISEYEPINGAVKSKTMFDAASAKDWYEVASILSTPAAQKSK